MDYLQSIQSAIKFIEDNLFEDIAPSTVAAHIGFSEYHFHRIFHGMLAESVASYIRKRRIFESARLLRTTDKSIYELASLAQFESYEAFGRAFKKIYKLSPTKYRQRKHGGWDFQKAPTTKRMLEHLQTGLTLNPTFVERDTEQVIGLAASYGDYHRYKIELLWKSFLKRTHEIKEPKPGVALGIYLAEHPQIKKSPDDTYIYVAGLPVFGPTTIPTGMVSITIPKGQYAVFTHKGNLDTVIDSIDYIWGTWIPKNLEHYQHVNGPDFELYDSRFDLSNRFGEIDQYVPVQFLK